MNKNRAISQNHQRTYINDHWCMYFNKKWRGLQLCTCFPHVSKIQTLKYNRANSVIIKNAIILNMKGLHSIYNLSYTEWQLRSHKNLVENLTLLDTKGVILVLPIFSFLQSLMTHDVSLLLSKIQKNIACLKVT